MSVVELARLSAAETTNDANPFAHLPCPGMAQRALCGTPLRTPPITAPPEVERCVVCAEMGSL